MPAADTSWADDLDLICRAATSAGAVALSHFRQSPEVWWKNEGRSPVSAADYAANARLEAMLRPARPAYGWLSEETEDNPDRLSCETLFVVDPIDGTRAFINGEDTWCVSVAVVHRGRPVAGVLVAPAHGESFAAVIGGAATCNGAPLEGAEAPAETSPRWRVAASEDILSRVATGFRPEIDRVRHVPSLAYRLAMVAAGRIDGTLVKRHSHDWDLAAADLILAATGGSLTDLDGAALTYNRPEVTHGVLVAGSRDFHPLLLRQRGRIGDG